MTDKKDAERYRWLRDQSLQYLVEGPICVMADKWGDLVNSAGDTNTTSCYGVPRFAHVTVDGASLDEAIDKAIADSK